MYVHSNDEQKLPIIGKTAIKIQCVKHERHQKVHTTNSIEKACLYLLSFC